MRLFRRHPWLGDGLITGVAAFCAAASVYFVADLIGWPGALALHAIPPLALIWRRRYPVPVLAVTLVTSLVQWGLAVPYGGAQVSVLFALYTVGRHEPRRVSRLALAAVLLGGLVAPLRQPYAGPANTLFSALIIVLVHVLATNVELRATYLRELEERAARLERERDAAAAVAVADERARIARELHDVVAHHVSVMVVQAEGAGWALDDAPEQAREAVGTIADTGRATLGELRRLLGVMRADGVHDLEPQPGLAELGALVARFRNNGLPVSLTAPPAEANLPESLQLAVFRMIQEGLTNVLRHAGPGAGATVTVTVSPDRLVVEVVDDGGGPADRGPSAAREPGPAAVPSGHGLVGIRERVALFGGRCEIGAVAGGFRIWAELPR